MPAIGIDLGTTNSCVAVIKNSQVVIVQNEAGNRVTPSWVAFTEEGQLVGEAAKLQLTRNPKNTVFGIKRIIGRTFKDSVVQEQKKKWEYEVVNHQGKPKVKVIEQGRSRSISPEEISSMILGHMKKIAEDFLGDDVYSAVITVPAYFNNSQRSATKDAAAIAGLHVLGMINEPTAAAVAYGLQQKIESRNVLIFDLGGGTFDVTLMSITDGIFDVKATAGDTNLGGEDFTENLFEHLANEFKAKNQNKDLKGNAKSRCILKKESETTKRQLSANNVTKQSVFIDCIFDQIDLDCTVTRATFENLNETQFARTLVFVKDVLREGKMNKDQIHEVVLVGGSTRIPRVREILEGFFGKGKVCKKINPDEAVAYGAAVQAAFLSGNVSAQLITPKLELRDVTPLSLGTKTKDGDMSVIIRRNTKIPTMQKRTYKIMSDAYSFVNIEVFEGGSEKCAENNHLGTVVLNGLPSKKGKVQIAVCFKLDTNGILIVSVSDSDGRLSESMTIKMNSAKMTDEEIQKLIEQYQKMYKEDEGAKDDKSRKHKETERVKGENKALNELASYVNNIRTTLQHMPINPGSRESVNCEGLIMKCNEITEWIVKHQNATPEEVAKQRKDLDLLCKVLL